MPHPQLFLLLSQRPFPPSPLPPPIGISTAVHAARLTRSYPSPSSICLHADLSALYLYQVIHQPPPAHPPSPPTPLRDRRRINMAARWLSARSAHLLVCVSRLLEVQPPPPLTCRVCLACWSFCFSFLGQHSDSQNDCSVSIQLGLISVVLMIISFTAFDASVLTKVMAKIWECGDSGATK